MEQVILPLFISFALYAALFVLIQQKKKQQKDAAVKGKPSAVHQPVLHLQYMANTDHGVFHGF